jgi:hypothetical protein
MGSGSGYSWKGMMLGLSIIGFDFGGDGATGLGFSFSAGCVGLGTSENLFSALTGLFESKEGSMVFFLGFFLHSLKPTYFGTPR